MFAIEKFTSPARESCSMALDFVNVFFRANIADNGSVERFANYCLEPLRLPFTLGGRKIYLLEKTYRIEDEEMHQFVRNLCFGEGATSSIFLIASIITGIFLKLTAWLFIPGVFHNNARFIHMRAEELVQHKNWSYDCQLQSRAAFASFGLIQMPLDMLVEIAKHIPVESRPLFSQVCTATYEASKRLHSQLLIKTEEKIKNRFPNVILNFLGKLDELATTPQMRLPAHRISEDPFDFRIQEYGNYIIKTKVDCISSKEMGRFSIKWGVEPIPFIAFQVHYQVPDHRFFLSFLAKIAYRFGLKKSLILDKKEVITIYQSGQNAQTKHQWSIKLPWLYLPLDIQTDQDVNEERAETKAAHQALQAIKNLIEKNGEKLSAIPSEWSNDILSINLIKV